MRPSKLTWLATLAAILTAAYAAPSSKASPFVVDLETVTPEQPERASAEFAPHPINVQDLINLDRVSPPVVAPTGALAVFSRTTYNQALDKSSTALYSVRLSDGTVSPLTDAQPGVSDSNPVFLPDGEIAFLSTRSGSSQIWSVNPENPSKSLKQLSSYPVDIESLRFSTALNTKDNVTTPGLFVFSARVYQDVENPLEDTAARDAILATRKSTGQVYTELYFRHWDQYSDHKVSHIFTAPLHDLNDVVDVMYQEPHESPVLPFGGAEEFDISPDGREIAFAAQKPGIDLAYTTNLNIYTVPSRGGRKPTSISEFNLAQDSIPAYSPDGRFIAYLSMSVPGYEADQYRVTLFDRQTGVTTYLTGKSWDRSASSLSWSKDSQTLYLTATDSARERIFQLGVPSDLPDVEQINMNLLPKLLLADGASTTPIVVEDANTKRLVFSRSTLSSPPDIYSLDLNTKVLSQLTSVNADKLANTIVPGASEFFFKGANGDRVQAWILRPANFDATKKYPVAFLIHGGPESAWQDSWSFRWNPALYAAAGYVAITVNPHGSTGFGQGFTDSINENWGGAPFDDLMRGLDKAGELFPFVDLKRVCALGASYGGYMINWINGHTDRFRCLVNHDGLFSTVSMAYSTEELFFSEKEFGGSPWNPRSRAIHEKWNPERFVANWKTPTLVIHGGKDYRVSETEGLSTFTALRRKGVEARLLYFPNENHWVLRRPNVVQWYTEILNWLDKHLNAVPRDEL